MVEIEDLGVKIACMKDVIGADSRSRCATDLREFEVCYHCV
ncbi:MAG: hypothetical protein ACYSSO_10605 [Planctomycetota bacterium]